MLLSDTKPGTRVQIVSDCRDKPTATGQTATFEGEFPRSVIVVDGPNNPRGEWAYEPFKAAGYLNVFPVWEQGKPRPEYPYVLILDNPRMKLDDGSVIWGDECWWHESADLGA